MHVCALCGLFHHSLYHALKGRTSGCVRQHTRLSRVDTCFLSQCIHVCLQGRVHFKLVLQQAPMLTRKLFHTRPHHYICHARKLALHGLLLR